MSGIAVCLLHHITHSLSSPRLILSRPLQNFNSLSKSPFPTFTSPLFDSSSYQSNLLHFRFRVAPRFAFSDEFSCSVPSTELNMYAEYPSQVMVKEFLFHERLKKKLPMTIPEMAILQLMLMCSNTHTLLMFTVSMLKLLCRMIKRAQKKARRRSRIERKKIIAARKNRILKKEKFIRTRTGHIKGVFLRRRPMSLTKNKMQSIVKKFPRIRSFRYTVGGVHDRVCLALIYLSHRYIEVNSDWEFWTVCLMSQACNYDRSISFGSSILQVEHFKMIATRLKISVVPALLFQRLDSSGYCSPPPRNSFAVRMRKSKGKRATVEFSFRKEVL